MQKIWLSNYSPNVPEEIDPDSTSSCLSLFETSVTKYRDCLAFANNDRNITYYELDMLTRQFAAYLQTKLGIKKVTGWP